MNGGFKITFVIPWQRFCRKKKGGILSANNTNTSPLVLFFFCQLLKIEENKMSHKFIFLL